MQHLLIFLTRGWFLSGCIVEISQNVLCIGDYHSVTIPLVSAGSRGVQLEQISFGLSCSWGLDGGETEANSVVKSIMY